MKTKGRNKKASRNLLRGAAQPLFVTVFRAWYSERAGSHAGVIKMIVYFDKVDLM